MILPGLKERSKKLAIVWWIGVATLVLNAVIVLGNRWMDARREQLDALAVAEAPSSVRGPEFLERAMEFLARQGRDGPVDEAAVVGTLGEPDRALRDERGSVFLYYFKFGSADSAARLALTAGKLDLEVKDVRRLTIAERAYPQYTPASRPPAP